jgi:ornithine cyclodeaminase/alanine dehydrogenase-like protein (mu-crystallin family)
MISMKCGSSTMVANRCIVPGYLLTDGATVGFVAALPPVYHRSWLDVSSATYFCVAGRHTLALFLTEADVRALLTPPVAVDLVDDVFRLQGQGGAENRPRVRIPYPDGLFQSMPAAVPARSSVGLKAYASGRAGATFVVLLFDTAGNELLAILEADWLGRIRTGAASGVATRYLARDDARVLGVIGAGSQAQTQIEAICAVRNIEQIKVFSRTAERREAFAHEMAERLTSSVQAVASAESAVRGSDIVVTITSSRDPVFDGSWLEPGCHVNAAGSNGANRREIDRVTVERAAIVAVDSLEQARIECGDLIAAEAEGAFEWTRAVELSQIVTGAVTREEAESTTLFESQGVAVEDVICARHVYDRAMEEGRGRAIDFEGRG